MKSQLEEIDKERQEWDEKLKRKDNELTEMRCTVDMVKAKSVELEKMLQIAEIRFNNSYLLLPNIIQTKKLTDKQRTNATIRHIIAERQALDESLTKMERENMELYRNCNELKDRVYMEFKVMEFKFEIEQMSKQREYLYVRKLKVCESKILALKRRLDAERKRRLEAGNPNPSMQQHQRELGLDLSHSNSLIYQSSQHRPQEHREVTLEVKYQV
ncbi:unnamed protein product [Thelazia callipaeda]|uniref:CC172 protein n=1 Tax=Thelazia callipaeda TaxID=103827 RepID=A0A0N5D9Y6_THECL|nr:unnamed protein product [Thelazia callipaeda]